MAAPDFVTIVMAGGSGTRFFPLSRRNFPKQYLKLFSERTLIQETIDRIAPLCPPEKTFVCSGESQTHILDDQLPPSIGRILEPSAMNTAPCIMLSTIELLRRGFSPNTVMVVLPADHFVADIDKFRLTIEKAVSFASENPGLVTLGIFPTHPHTGYGYIEAGDMSPTDGIFKVRRFVEKPTRAKAEKLLKQRNHYWNGGIFIWTLHSIAESFQEHMPAAWEVMQTFQSKEDLSRIYSQMESTPIDVAILEKSNNVFMVPADMGWNDIGSWNALYDLKTHTSQEHVVLSGKTHSVQSRNCLVRVDKERRVALVGVENLIIVESEGVLLIADREQDQLVREAAKEMDPP